MWKDYLEINLGEFKTILITLRIVSIPLLAEWILDEYERRE